MILNAWRITAETKLKVSNEEIRVGIPGQSDANAPESHRTAPASRLRTCQNSLGPAVLQVITLQPLFSYRNECLILILGNLHLSLPEQLHCCITPDYECQLTPAGNAKGSHISQTPKLHPALTHLCFAAQLWVAFPSSLVALALYKAPSLTLSFPAVSAFPGLLHCPQPLWAGPKTHTNARPENTIFYQQWQNSSTCFFYTL